MMHKKIVLALECLSSTEPTTTISLMTPTVTPHLTERDMQLLLDVYKYRYLSTSQLTRLHFVSEKTTWRRLSILVNQEYLARFNAPSIPEYLYHLGKAGIEIVAAQLQVEPEQLPGTRTTRTPKDYYFLRHFLKINDFRIALTLGCQVSGMELLGFIPEYLGEKTERGGVVKFITEVVTDRAHPRDLIRHTPDGVFALGKDGKAALFFLEVDRGTEAIANEEKGFLKTLKFYLNYWTDEKYQRYQAEFRCAEPFKAFRTLVVTTSAARLQNMRAACSSFPFQPAHARRFIWLTTDEQISPETIFEQVWQSAEIGDEKRYQIG